MSLYYQDDLITLYHGDCEQILPTIPSGSYQIVVTSPPYNMGLTPGGNGRGMYRPGISSRGGKFRDGYGNHDDAMPQDEYDAWQRRVLQLLWSGIADDGAIYYNHRQRIEHGIVRLPLGMDFGLPLRQVITWDRAVGIGVNRRHYCATGEWVMLFAKPDFMLASHSASGAGDVWRLGRARKADTNGHKAAFPVTLPATAIATSAAGSVLDPFVGSGSTLFAARDAGIPGVGIDNDERLCEIMARQLTIRAVEAEFPWLKKA